MKIRSRGSSEDLGEIPGMVEEDLYKLQSRDSLQRHYNKKEVEYIVRRRTVKKGEKIEVIGLMGEDY